MTYPRERRGGVACRSCQSQVTLGSKWVGFYRDLATGGGDNVRSLRCLSPPPSLPSPPEWRGVPPQLAQPALPEMSHLCHPPPRLTKKLHGGREGWGGGGGRRHMPTHPFLRQRRPRRPRRMPPIKGDPIGPQNQLALVGPAGNTSSPLPWVSHDLLTTPPPVPLSGDVDLGLRQFFHAPPTEFD